MQSQIDESVPLPAPIDDGRRVWQIAAGDRGRNFSRLFLKHDLMFLGPGRFGPFDPEAYRRAVLLEEVTGQKIGAIGAFCSKMSPGDIVLLRKGYEVIGIGVIPKATDSGYRHDDTFDDVYGWDLQHTRRIVWQEHLASRLQAMQQSAHLFSARKQIPTFTGVGDPAVLNPIRELFNQIENRDLKPLPTPPPPPLSLEELGRELFSRGLANDAVDKLQLAIERQRRLAAWYAAHGKTSKRPDEHEVVAHMVLPMLLALGWSEQLLAIEWGKIDLAGFSGTPTIADRCVLVCEAKRMDAGMNDVGEQAMNYVAKHRLDACKKMLLTQGTRFYLFARSGDRWPDEPTGYLNVERIRTNHLAPLGTNAVDTLMALTPAGVLQD
jgi:hypothetical protein